MDKNELLQIKETYNNAGYFMLYVDEVNFDQKLLNKLMRDGIYTVNDFEEKFIAENYPETNEIMTNVKTFLQSLIKDMSNGILSAESKNIDEILEAFSELLKTDKLAISKLELQKFENAEFLKTLISRHYEIADRTNTTERDAFLKYIDEKHKEYLKSIETKKEEV